MHARVMTGQTKPDKQQELAEAIHTYQTSIVSTAEKEQGFNGALLLTNPHTGKIMSLTFWETEGKMQAGETGDYFQAQIAKLASFMAGPGIVDHFQVSVQAQGHKG